MSKTRNITIDILKAIAILAVIMGHCIQYGSGGNYLKEKLYFENIIFKFIYSFHMPLFMIISGYLFKFSIQQGFKTNLIKKIKNLVIPIFAWASFPLFFRILTNQMINITIENIFTYYFNTAITHLWFLWAVFWCSFIVLIIYHFLQNNIWVYIILWITSFLIPDIYNLELYKFMYPYFILGFFYNSKQNKIIRYNNHLYITIAILFITLLFFYNYNAYIYTSGHYIGNNNFITQMIINSYRYIIGFIGSIFIIISILKIFKFIKPSIISMLSYIGKRTMGLYIISGFINTSLLTSLTYKVKEINYLITILESIGILILTLTIIYIIQHSKLFNRLLLGSNKS